MRTIAATAATATIAAAATGPTAAAARIAAAATTAGRFQQRRGGGFGSARVGEDRSAAVVALTLRAAGGIDGRDPPYPAPQPLLGLLAVIAAPARVEGEREQAAAAAAATVSSRRQAPVADTGSSAAAARAAAGSVVGAVGGDIKGPAPASGSCRGRAAFSHRLPLLVLLPLMSLLSLLSLLSMLPMLPMLLLRNAGGRMRGHTQLKPPGRR